MTDERRMSTVDELRAAGASPKAIELHYDLSDEFFGLWLGADMVYSCALWDPTDAADNLARAQQRKLDHFATAPRRSWSARSRHRLRLGSDARPHGPRARRCGRRWADAQPKSASVRRGAGRAGGRVPPYGAGSTTTRSRPYDAITCIEMTEHLASDALDRRRQGRGVPSLLRPVRRLAWRCGPDGLAADLPGQRRARRQPTGSRSDQRADPNGDLPGVDAGLDRRAGAWLGDAFPPRRVPRPHRPLPPHVPGVGTRCPGRRRRAAKASSATTTCARSQAYFAAGEALFRLREHALYRVVLTKRPRPKQWAAPLLPSGLPGEEHDRRPDPADSASAAAVRSHYDLSNDFYRLWLGPTMMYTSGMWPAASDDPLDAAVERKIDYFAEPPCRPVRAACSMSDAAGVAPCAGSSSSTA